MFYAILCLFCGFEARESGFLSLTFWLAQKKINRERKQGLQSETRPGCTFPKKSGIRRTRFHKKSRSLKGQSLDYDFQISSFANDLQNAAKNVWSCYSWAIFQIKILYSFLFCLLLYCLLCYDQGILQLGARHYAEECYIHSCFVCCSTVLWSRYIPVRCEALSCLLRCCAMSRYMYMYVFVPFRSKALCWGLLFVVHELKCFNVKILFELPSLFRVPWDDALGKIVSSGEGFELDTFKLYNYWFWGQSVNTLSMILFTFSVLFWYKLKECKAILYFL